MLIYLKLVLVAEALIVGHFRLFLALTLKSEEICLLIFDHSVSFTQNQHYHHREEQGDDVCAEISDKVYRFSAMDLTAEERATIHGNNEKVRLEGICRAVEFYIRLMKKI